MNSPVNLLFVHSLKTFYSLSRSGGHEFFKSKSRSITFRELELILRTLSSKFHTFFRKPLKYRGKDSISGMSSYALPSHYSINPADLGKNNIHAEIRLDQVSLYFVGYKKNWLASLDRPNRPGEKCKKILKY